MTQDSQTTPPTVAPKGMDVSRMFKVWVVLAGSMTAAALACWAAMPELQPPERLDGRPQTDAEIESLIWPDDMAPNRPWRYIVIHHSATPSATLEAIERYHQSIGFNEVGYHLVINNGKARGTVDGQIRPTTRWTEQLGGAHAKIAHHPEYNREGIGICLVGNFEEHPPTARQMASLERLVLALRRRYGIPLEGIVGHGELKNTKCPGKLLPMETFLMDLRQVAIDEHLETPPD